MGDAAARSTDEGIIARGWAGVFEEPSSSCACNRCGRSSLEAALGELPDESDVAATARGYTWRCDHCRALLHRVPIVSGARVDTSPLYPTSPVAIVEKVFKGDCATLDYPDNTKDPPRSLAWVREHLVVCPRKEDYHAVMFDEHRECWLVRNDTSRAVYRITRRVLEDDLEAWILDCATANPLCWLPVQNCFLKLQALKGAVWQGFLPGGIGRLLPDDYAHACFSEELLRECRDAAPRPVDCAAVGAAAMSSRRSNSYLSAPVVGLDCEPSAGGGGAGAVGGSLVGGSRFAGCAEDYCVTFALAGALDRLGDAEAADLVASLAPASLAQSKNRVKWVTHECVRTLQRLGWTTRTVKNAQMLSKADVLAARPSVVTVYQIRDSSAFVEHAFATLASVDGRKKWVHDMNRGYLALTAKNLDACCIGEGTTFEGVVSAFVLEKKAQAEKRKRASGAPRAI